MKKILPLFLTIMVVLAMPATAADIRIDKAWARETGSRTQSAAAYFSVTNSGASPDRLLGVSAPFAGHAMVHVTEVDENGIARMQPAGAIDIAAGETIRLAPRGAHVMLMQLNEGLSRGEQRRIVLRFEKAGDIAVDLCVMPITGVDWSQDCK